MTENLAPTDAPSVATSSARSSPPTSRRAGLAAPVTRFPPEPNGYLHIGHAKSICLNFGIAEEFGGRCNLRFDDTNPVKEEQEYIDSIQADIRWLGFDWGEHLHFASDYFEQLYDWAVHLIRAGPRLRRRPVAPTRSASIRGTLTDARPQLPVARSLGRGEPRPVRADAGRRVPERRARPAREDRHGSPNINLRDPVLYRIVHASHPRTGDAWCIYPTYDFAHGQSDAIEGVTHSICTLEFEVHRPLYDWLIEHLPVPSRPAPVRVRPAQPDVHGPVEAVPAAAGQRGPRPRLGRPAHADDLRAAAARLPGRGDPRLRDGDRRGQDRQSSEVGSARVTRCATSSTGRRHGGSRPRSAQGRHRRTTPTGRSRRWTSSTTRRTRRPALAASRSRASCGSSGTTSWRSRRPSSSGWRRVARFGCGPPTS